MVVPAGGTAREYGPAMTLRRQGEELLGRLTGNPHARFRTGQWEAIEQLVESRGRALVVQRTGWGKSGVYFIATRLLRDAGAGPTLLVSPLLALMRNQLDMAARVGVVADTINSTNSELWDDIEDRIRSGRSDIVLISPERLNNARFVEEVLPHIASRVGLLVVDEAHCISDWGHDFRPDYRRIARVIKLLPATVPVLCTTATANDRVIDDIKEQLGEGLEVIRGPLHRSSLELAVVDLPDPAARLCWLSDVIPTLAGSGIVYCLTVDDTDRVARWLTGRGISAAAYSGQAQHEDRLAAEEALLANDVKVVVATSALGMGFDKPDLSFVIHYQSPGSPIAYYQQVGRAGRGLDQATAVLLRGHEDTEIQDYFIKTAFPEKEQAEAVVTLLARAASPVSLQTIEAGVNIRRGRLESMLKILEVEGVVERVGVRWQRTVRPWSYPEERVEKVTASRRAEQAAMNDYAFTRECRMTFLLRMLDDPDARPCGRCDNCSGRRLDRHIHPGAIVEAGRFLRSERFDLEPRLRWPAGLDGVGGTIEIDRRLQPGKILAAYGDHGWGDLVRRGKYTDHVFSDDLVAASVRLIHSWRPEPQPRWLTFVPSTTSGEIVASFAARLAEALHLEFRDVIVRVRPGRPQKAMENSSQQARNVYGAFEVRGAMLSTPVLLVDDVVDSRWTLTVIASLLREAGSGPVFPFALAKATSR